MNLSREEKEGILKQVQEEMADDTLQMEDAIKIMEILEAAARRRKEKILAENPWLHESDIVQ